MKLRNILVMSVIVAVTIGFVGVGTVHAQMLDGKWYKGQVISVEKELMPDGRIETESGRLPVFMFFENPVAHEPPACDGFDYDVSLVAFIDDGGGEYVLLDTGSFSTCGADEKGGVFRFNFLTPDPDPDKQDDITVYFNGKLIKHKKFVSRGCVILIDTFVDVTGTGAPAIISRNCKILLKLTKCEKLPFDPATLGFDPC
jgi:hypothetical protein